jgi:hypothetical protein
MTKGKFGGANSFGGHWPQAIPPFIIGKYE